MPRYGAKTYGKGQKKEENQDGSFDSLWTKSIGSKMAAPEFSPVKPSPVKKSQSRDKATVLISSGQSSPSRHYVTRSSPEKQATNNIPAGVRRTRRNSSAEDPFSFSSDDENSKSPIRKSARPTRNSSPPMEQESYDSSQSQSKGRSKLFVNPNKRVGQTSGNDLSASRNTCSRDKKQVPITRFTSKIPNESDIDSCEQTSGLSILGQSSSKSDSSSSPEVIVISDSSDSQGVFEKRNKNNSLSLQGKNANKKNQSLSRTTLPTVLETPDTISSLRSGAPSLPQKQIPVPPKGNLVLKRKSRDLRSNGESANTTFDNSLGQSSTNNIGNTVKDARHVNKDLVKSDAQRHEEDMKDEFSFDDDSFDEPSSRSQSSQGSSDGSKPPGLVKSRSRELPGVKRRIFNSPKKSPMKAKYNARSWATSNTSSEIEEFSNEDSVSSISTASTSTSGIENSESSATASSQSTKTGLTRVDKYPNKKNHSIVTSIKCHKQEKKYYTVVKHVKQALQCQDAGESQQFSDDIEYLLDGLKKSLASSTRCLSTISLMEKSTAASFRMHLRAHSTIAKIFAALSDAPSDPCLALCTAGLMYMLSKDRLNMDLDRSSLTLLVQLLSMDSEVSRLSWSPTEQEEYEKTREKLWGIVKTAAKGNPNQLFGVDQQTLSSGFFAMESLLSLTSKRAGEWFKEELRFAGGLELIAQTVMKATEKLTVLNKEPTHMELVHLRTLNRCVRVLENVTFMNSDNQQHLLEMQKCSLIKALASFLSLCENHIELCTTDEDNKEEQNLAKLVTQGLLANLRLLLNLTHDNEWGSMKVGDQEGLMLTVLQCVLQLPQYLPNDKKFDLLVLSLGLLINLVEHSVANTRIVTGLKTCHSYDSQPEVDQSSIEGVKEVTAIEALTELFLQRQRAAEKLENEDDDEEVPEEEQNDMDDWVTVETEPIPGASSAAQQLTQEEIKQSIKKALHTAGKHMEDSIVASYAALLLGCLLRENKLNVNRVRDCLPNGDFTCMVDMLKKLLNFMELTDADGNTGKRSISKVIEVLECC